MITMEVVVEKVVLTSSFVRVCQTTGARQLRSPEVRL